MKKIGFLSFGHWTPPSQSQTRSAADTLLQSIELAVAAEELGADGAYFRVHHFARQLASPFPLLFALIDDRDLAYFGSGREDEDQIGFIDPRTRAIFGRSYAAEPNVLIEQLKTDKAIAEADTLLLTAPTSWAWSTTRM